MLASTDFIGPFLLMAGPLVGSHSAFSSSDASAHLFSSARFVLCLFMLPVCRRRSGLHRFSLPPSALCFLSSVRFLRLRRSVAVPLRWCGVWAGSALRPARLVRLVAHSEYTQRLVTHTRTLYQRTGGDDKTSQ